MNATFKPQFFRLALAVAMAATLALTGAAAHAQGSTTVSDLSAASMLPVAVSVTASVALISAGAALTVVAVEGASVGVSTGTVWVLERVSDGVRGSVTLSAEAARGLSVAVGTVVVVSAVTAGWVLSAAGQAVAFIPNELGKALLHNEKVTK